MKRAVERGLQRRSLDEVRHVVIDEKSFGAGQDYVSVMTDIDQSRVLEVTPDRTTEAADALWNTLSEEQRSKVKAVCMDMWQAYETSTERNVPNARIVHDRFHIPTTTSHSLELSLSPVLSTLTPPARQPEISSSARPSLLPDSLSHSMLVHQEISPCPVT
jgi:transposase